MNRALGEDTPAIAVESTSSFRPPRSMVATRFSDLRSANESGSARFLADPLGYERMVSKEAR